MEAFVTHCDRNYVSRAIAMTLSLRITNGIDPVVVIYHDEDTKLAFEKFNIFNLTLVSSQDLMRTFPELVIARANRSLVEFYYCLSPFTIKYVKKLFPNMVINYVDADIYFFSPFRSAETNLPKDFSTSIVPHNFKLRDNYLEKYGKFNVGIVSANYEKSDQVINWWANACLESTSINATEIVFGDQKYLDNFENIDKNCHVSNSIGENAAPWNLDAKDLDVRDGSLMICGETLVYYHFSGLRIFNGIVSMGFAGYSKRASNEIWRNIYKPYLRVLRSVEQKTEIRSSQKFRIFNLHLWLRQIFYTDVRFMKI